ncbi:MAG: beta-galactosidase [Bacteroidota bacterium]
MKIYINLLLFFLTFTSISKAQNKEGIDYLLIGKVKPKSAHAIDVNNWSIGAETMDRDLVKYDSWKDYIGELGAKKVRLQAGWAKCEKEKGAYDFAWLDEVVDGVIADGVEPWLQTSYGNPIYEGGGGIHLTAGLPTSVEALAAWDNWVSTMVKRYQGRVKIWEVWNEPDGKNNNPPDMYANFYIRTAEIIRAIDPNATIYALSIASIGKKGQNYTETFFEILKEKGKLHLVDEVTLHGYTYNPSEIYGSYQQMHKIISKYAKHVKLRQGELGCPSENQSVYALRNYEWTELSQSKWVLRKMMGDLGRDIPSSYFLIIDIVYTHNHSELMETPKRNTKGLIKSDLERNFVAKKQAFYSYQNATAIFDYTLERMPNYPYEVNSDSSLSLFAYQEKHFDKQVVVAWLDSQIPTNSNSKTAMTFEFLQGNFEVPVFVDLRTGDVYEIPEESFTKRGTKYIFNDIPIYDSPILIADKSIINLKNSDSSK